MIHIPVLLNAVLEHIKCNDDGLYLDCTFGGGGYSRAFLQSARCKVFSIDKDSNVEMHANALKEEYPERFDFQISEFTDISQLFPGYEFDGIALDIGVSSMQIDEDHRGFSFYRDGPLDMRMNQKQVLNASYIVNHYTEADLNDLIRIYGDERKSKKIAQLIVEERETEPITRTLRLANIIKKAVGHYNDSIHPATRTFQALRIVVNDEIEQLRLALKAATDLLKIGGRIAIVTFHSGEDQIVKEYFASICSKPQKVNKYQEFSLQQSNTSQEAFRFQMVNKKPIIPSRQEIKNNVRCRSAKLRVIERLR